MENASKPARRRWYKRPSRIIPLAVVVVVAIAVPVAWATFTDVPPSNPFYADVNAIQGAGVTQGCGGGNFCPLDNITRQAEAAFVHRAAGRTGMNEGGIGTVPTDGSAVVLAQITLSVGGAAGGTQFVKLDGNVNTYINSTTNCPCQTHSYITQGATAPGNVISEYGYTNNTFVGPSGYGLDGTGVSTVVAVPSGSTQTFRLVASKWDGTGAVSAFGRLTAITAPFGSGGASTLGETGASNAKPGSPAYHPTR